MSTQALANALTMAGLEVEELRPVAPPFTQVVVGEIMAAERHPNADRLRVCQVAVGGEKLLNIVCGAPNARVGIKVPCALVGAELPAAEGSDTPSEPFRIKLGKLRGVESEGMLCSARELKLSDDHGGLLELPSDAKLGQNVRETLGLDDMLFTLKLTPNKADCLSVLGVAREVAAITGAPLTVPPVTAATPTAERVLPVRIEAPDLCGRFSGRVVLGVRPDAKTPQWMVDRLARCGQRSVSPLVDISNYVMFELGRPSHIFDLDKIHGGLSVRWGRVGEQLKLLNGSTVTLDGQVGVIADDAQVESLAGIMGGDATAVGDTTTNIYIEAAFWHPAAIAGRSRRFKFSTDAGHRFERGVDFATTAEHVERITALVLSICGDSHTQAGPLDDQVVNLPTRKPVTMRVDRASKVIGMAVTAEQCANAFKRLGLSHSVDAAKGVITVTPSSHRFDIEIEEDLIEEVARLIGFEQLPTNPPVAPVAPTAHPEATRGRFALRRQMAGLGYLETINFSFVPQAWEADFAANANPVRLLNPIASEMNVMRSTLIGSLVGALRYNLDRKASMVRIFELGRVFRRDSSVKADLSHVTGLAQPLRLAGLAFGPATPVQWGQATRIVDFFDVKGDVQTLLGNAVATFAPPAAGDAHPALHPGRSATVLRDGLLIGHLGELHPKWVQSYGLASAPVVFELDVSAAQLAQMPQPRPAPKLQSVLRDLAVIVPRSVTHDQMMAAVAPVRQAGVLRDVFVFDLFAPKQATAGMSDDEMSVALRLEMRDDAAPMTDQAIDGLTHAVLVALTESAANGGVGARLRG